MYQSLFNFSINISKYEFGSVDIGIRFNYYAIMYKNKSPLHASKKPVKNDWHRADIIAAVRKSGTNLQQLSRQYNLGRTTLSNALYRPCPRYEKLIAEHLGITPQAIWPSRYHEDGLPKSGRGERGIGRYLVKGNTGNSTPLNKTCNVFNKNNKGADAT